jgi:ATP phosphoribosyltransferase
LLCLSTLRAIIYNKKKEFLGRKKMEKLKILLAKGRIYESVYELLSDVGISIHLPDRTYFPTTNQKDLAFQVVKPQIVSNLLANNKADVGFSGKDWIYENGVEDQVEEIMDLGFDPVKIVAAIPDTVDYDALLKGHVTIATEYQKLSSNWVNDKKIDGTIFRTWGTSEGFVQDNEDSIAQILIDNTSTGSSLKANRFKIVDTLMESSTRMYASKTAMADPEKRQKIMELKMLFCAVMDARGRVMLEMNVAKDKFENMVKSLPAMRSPTVAPLYSDDGYAVKIAVNKSEVPTLLPKLKEFGATDIVEYELRKVIN